MRITAKADYAVRAALELAAAPDGEPVKGEHLAESQEIPLQFLEHILLELKHARLVRAKRGARGGYWLARPADDITVADVIRAVEGPLANIQDCGPGGHRVPGPGGAPAGRLDRGPRQPARRARAGHTGGHLRGPAAGADRAPGRRPGRLGEALSRAIRTGHAGNAALARSC